MGCESGVFQHSNTPALQHSVFSGYSSVKMILMWQLRFRMGPAEPRAFGVKRRRVEAVWGTASLIRSRAVLRPPYSVLCSLRASAFALAVLMVLATKRAPLRGTARRTAFAG